MRLVGLVLIHVWQSVTSRKMETKSSLHTGAPVCAHVHRPAAPITASEDPLSLGMTWKHPVQQLLEASRLAVQHHCSQKSLPMQRLPLHPARTCEASSGEI